MVYRALVLTPPARGVASRRRRLEILCAPERLHMRPAYHVGPLSMLLPAVDECAVPSALPAKRAVPVAFEGRK